MLTQVTVNMSIHFVILAKHSPVNDKKYAAMSSILIKESENRFQDRQKIISFLVYLQVHFQSTKMHCL